jgi:hypothetical protein
MSTKRLVAVLLLAFLGNPAAAAEPTELRTKDPRTAVDAPETTAESPRRESSSKARKVLQLLGNMGLDNRDVRSLVRTADSRIDDGYFRIGEHALPESQGKILLRYRLGGGVDPVLSGSNKQGVRRLELYYTPRENSRWEAVATKKYVVVNYKIPLDKLAW